jgi:hypothetical protein
MDLLEAGCQGLGLALAAGALFGALGLTGRAGAVLAALAVFAGAAVFGSSLTPEDHPAWPGWIAGAAAGLLAYATARDIAVSARTRAGGGVGGGIAAYIGAFAILLAAVSLADRAALVSILALIAVLWLYATRRRKAARKHAGLRTLR